MDEYECPDCLIAYSRKYNEYGIIVHDGGTSNVLILYCPWCGAKLDFVHYVMPAQAPASHNGQSQRHFSMSYLDNDIEKYQAPNVAA